MIYGMGGLTKFLGNRNIFQEHTEQGDEKLKTHSLLLNQ